MATAGIAKSPTGIVGLDEITGGGLPTGRPTLVCGATGCGKTLLAMEFLVRGATQYGEPGVFLAFEETAKELTENVRSLGFELEGLIAEKKLAIDHVHIDRGELEETGEYDLEGLFVRLNYAVTSIGAKRVVLDTLETLFGGLSNTAILRAEIRRLFRWLKDRGVTAVVTAERSEEGFTRHELEEYVSDCVIVLDHRVTEQLSTRRLRILKYRGSVHGTNEYPFLIGEQGISVVPITSARLTHDASTERVSTGVPSLDALMGGKGFFRGASVMISGTAGTGKTTLAALFATACCARGERTLYLSFEESPQQLIRNMRSVGIELQSWIDRGLLEVHSARPSLHGLEMHLTMLHNHVRRFAPRAVVVDPLSNFATVGSHLESEAMLTRLVDYLKAQQITAVFTSLSTGRATSEHSELGISSVIDTWIVIRDLEERFNRVRTLSVLKSRGMDHSHQTHRLVINDRGVELQPLDPLEGRTPSAATARP